MYKVVVVKVEKDQYGKTIAENSNQLEKLLNAGWIIHRSEAMRDSCLIVLKQGKES